MKKMPELVAEHRRALREARQTAREKRTQIPQFKVSLGAACALDWLLIRIWWRAVHPRCSVVGAGGDHAEIDNGIRTQPSGILTQCCSTFEPLKLYEYYVLVLLCGRQRAR